MPAPSCSGRITKEDLNVLSHALQETGARGRVEGMQLELTSFRCVSVFSTLCLPGYSEMLVVQAVP